MMANLSLVRRELRKREEKERIYNLYHIAVREYEMHSR